MSPALLTLAEACYPKLDWPKAVEAAKALALELKIEAHLEALFLDQHKPCECSSCGNKHAITRFKGVYFNGRLVHELVQEADAEVHRANRRLALGL